MLNKLTFHFIDGLSKCNVRNSKEDLMLQTLRQGLSPSKLFNYIDSNKHQIKREHVIAALSSLHSFYQDKSHYTTNLDEQMDFTKLCTYLKPQIEQLAPIETIEALNILQLLNVPSTNIFINTLLQHIEESIEELSPRDIYELVVLLDKFVPTALSKSIDSAIISEFLRRISELDKSDISTMIYALCFASRSCQDKAAINILSDAVENYKTRIELEDAIDILKLLCSIKELPYKFTNVIKQVQQIISNNIDELKPTEILQIIQGISSKIRAK